MSSEQWVVSNEYGAMCFGTDFQPAVLLSSLSGDFVAGYWEHRLPAEAVAMGGPSLTPPLLWGGPFQEVSGGKQWVVSDEQRFWLEASTFSNRGEMCQHLPTDYGHTHYRWLEASTNSCYYRHPYRLFFPWQREDISLPHRGIFCERNVCFHEKITMVEKRIDGG